jgi:acyl-CoA thioesterase
VSAQDQELRPRLGLRPWLAFFLRARSVAFLVRFDMVGRRYRCQSKTPKSVRSALMADTGWEDLDLRADPRRPGRFTTQVSEPWMLVVVPQGGIVAAIAARAMAEVLGEPSQTLRSCTAVFAGQVAAGPVEVDVTVLRRGRSMSQLQATVRNLGAEAGLTAIAAFGAPRRGFDFTELVAPVVPDPEDLRGFRDPLPDGIDFEFDRPPMPFWEHVVECHPAIGRPPWEPFEDGPAEAAYWYRLDRPPLRADGRVDPLAAVVLCDTMPGAVGQKLGPAAGPWFGPSVDLTVHLFGAPRPGWLLAHNRARQAGDGYASVDMALWDPSDWSLVAYATQLMFFAFGV